MDSKDWMDHPKLKNMDREKLEALQKMADEGSRKSQNDLMSFFMAAASGGNRGMQFSPDEIGTIIEVIKGGKSPQEQEKLDRIISLIKMMRR